MPAAHVEEASALPPPGAALPVPANRRMAMLIACGIFVSTFSTDQNLALFPLRHVLATELHANALRISEFFFWCGLAWYLKPLLGILSDAFPIFGTRRRSYLLLGALASSLLWLGYLWAPHRYLPFLLLITGIDAGMVVISTVSGGLLVEEGQKAAATGKLSSVRNVMMCLAALAAGPISGALADRNFADTAIIGAALSAALVGVAWLHLREPRGAVADRSVLANAHAQVLTALRSRPLLLAALFTFLVSFAPGFSTPLYLYQTNTLHFSDAFIGGNLTVLGNAFGIAGSLAYIAVCRRFDLRRAIIIAIVAAGVSALAYLHYRTRHEAEFVESLYGFCSNIAQVMTLDIAAQATPAGCEAMAYALLMSAYNIAANLSDVIGSWIIDNFHLTLFGHTYVRHVTFPGLVWINSATTLLTLLAIPLLPSAMLSHRDRGPRPDDADKDRGRLRRQSRGRDT